VSDDDVAVLVDRLRWDRRRDPYRGRREYSQNVRALAEACERLIASGRAGQAVPVLRRAVDRITSALMYMDDSSGIVGDDLHDIMGLYARACAAAPPNPAGLAGWLVKLQCDGPGWPQIVLRDFAPALGERGIAEVERLVARRAQTADSQSWTGSFAVRDLREQLAEVSGDVDRYVALLAEHLTSAVQYERITLALLGAGRRQEAIAWARRGLAERPGWPHTDRLRAALVDMLLDDGDSEAAVVVRRTEFERHPTATAYRCLAETAGAVGAGDPTPWALTVLRDRVAQQPAYAPELIAILLALGHDEQAWLAGQEHRQWIHERQWLSLLERRGVSHPADVIGPYQDMVERYIRDSTDKRRYRRAVALLPALRAAYTATGDPAAFPAYMADLRLRHKRRPAFLKTLDAASI
jgi:uncharacterized Zn finger protein